MLSGYYEYVGSNGSGTFTQSGGTNTYGSTLLLGDKAGDSGTYALSGTGSIIGDTYQYIGGSGSGTFTQSGGSNQAGLSLYLGYNAGSSGTYALGGTGTLSAFYEIIGNSGSGTFTQSGGTNTITTQLTLGSNAGSNGTYNLAGGTLQVPGVTQGSGTGTFNFNGGTLQASANSTAFMAGLSAANVLAGGAQIDSNGNTITIAQALLTGTAAGTPDGGLTKLGAGTLIFTGASTYTGGTTVSAGTLLANNASGSATGSGAVQVQSGGTLGGSGTVAGMLTVASGGTLAPGPGAPGRLTLGSSLALNGGSTLAIALGGPTAGTQYAQVMVAGTATLAGNLSVAEVNGFKLAVGQTFLILDDTGTATTSGAFANTDGGFYTDAAGNTFQLDYAAVADGDGIGNDVTLTVMSVVTASVPEPGTWALLGVGIVVAGWVSRARRRAAR